MFADVRAFYLLGLLVMAALWDIRWRRIPNWMTCCGAALGVVCAFCGNAAALGTQSIFVHDAFGSVVGILVCLAVMLPLWLVKGTGGGDVKLAALLGAFLGWRLGISSIVWAHLCAAPLGLATILVDIFKTRSAVAPTRHVLSTRFPMGPSFLLGTLIILGGGKLL